MDGYNNFYKIEIIIDMLHSRRQQKKKTMIVVYRKLLINWKSFPCYMYIIMWYITHNNMYNKHCTIKYAVKFLQF